MDNRTNKRKLLSALFVVLIVVMAAVALVGMLFLRPAAVMLQGEVEAEQIRISGILAGRVAELMVGEGDHVEAGDTLVSIHSSLVEAQMSSATAMRMAAKAQNELVDAGVRQEIVKASYDVVLQAQAALSVAEKSFKRVQVLYEKGVVSAQRYDEAQAAYEIARATEGVARSEYDMAINGARREEKKASLAMLLAADGGVAEVQSLLDDALLVAPRAGVVSEIFPLEGELVSLGAPIMNIMLMNELWVSFNVREELLQKLSLNSHHEAVVPALGNEKILLQVYYVKDMGNYAVWKATKASGGYDAKTFNVRMRPVGHVEGMLPGMTVLLKDIVER